MQTLLELILDEEGNLNLDFNDEIVAGTVVAHQGEIPHPHMRKLLDLPELNTTRNGRGLNHGNFNFITGALCAVAISRC